jgi:DDE domain
MAAAKAFLRSAKSVTQVEPEQVTTDGHTSYPKAIADELGTDVDHRTSQYKNNVLEQDHRGVKGRYRPMRGFKAFGSADRFCQAFDEVRNFLRPTSYLNQNVSLARRRVIHVRRVAALRDLISVPCTASGSEWRACLQLAPKADRIPQPAAETRSMHQSLRSIIGNVLGIQRDINRQRVGHEIGNACRIAVVRIAIRFHNTVSGRGGGHDKL